MPTAGATETRTYIVSSFYPANYFAEDTCPNGLNPAADVFFKRDLKILGVPQNKIDELFEEHFNVEAGPLTTEWVALATTRGNGKDDVYLHPTTVPDAKLLPAIGQFGYGFDLDGTEGSDSYEDPVTHEKGVDNQLFRTIGCIQAYKGYKAYPPPRPPLEAEYRWDYSRAVTGAWLISISGEDLTSDGEVTVTFEKSIDPITTQDANAHIQSDLTYRVAAQPASSNVLRGEIKDGVVITYPDTITMKSAPYIQPEYEFLKARMRLNLKVDGNVQGVLGGYQPWYPLYWSHAKVGYIDERGFGVDAPALYHALQRNADAYPDPETGENTAISAAYLIEAVPAFVVRLDEAEDVSGTGRPRAGGAPSSLPATSSVMRRVARAFRSAEPESASRPAIMRRLRPDQYRNVITDVFGPQIEIRGWFEPEIRVNGLFAVGAGHAGVTSTGMEQYHAMARGIAAQVVSQDHRGTLIPCRPESATASDDSCAARFFEKVAPLLYRRPLTNDELSVAVHLANEVATALRSFYSGLEFSLTGMLVSPQFLFRQQVVEPDPARPGEYRLDAYSKASQLSFFLWNAGPDLKLMTAAHSGKLHSESGLASEVERMLESPRVAAGVRAFFSDMLQFSRFDMLAKDPEIYPKWTVRVAQDAQEQTLRTIVDLLWTKRGDYRELFTTRQTFLTPMLGSIYRVPVNQDSIVWHPYEFPRGDHRVGIQTHASFVALHSHEGLSSPTLRGQALREVLLCQPIPPPPANVDFAATGTHEGDFKTMRARLSAHATDPTCAGCHKLTDPPGLALENFDSDGSYRATANGEPLDASGDLGGIHFTDPIGLGRAIYDNPATGPCLVRRLHSYATGQAAVRRDMAWIRHLEKEFVADGYRLPDLIRSIATSRNLYRVDAPAGMQVAHDSSSKELAK